MNRLSVYKQANQSQTSEVQASQILVADRVKLADTFIKRFFGLMFKKQLAHGEGLYITPCQQIHTHFMKFNIDVIFLDTQMKVLHVERNMKPWEISKYYKAASGVLELKQHQAQLISMGDILSFLSTQVSSK
jgi:uncharacterized protein